MIDPTGMSANPVYDKSGTFLGTDDKGIAGDAIIIDNQKDFKQGMKHEDAKKLDKGVGALKTPEAKATFANHYYELNKRPDYDRFVTINEGIAWAKSHPNLDNDNNESNGLQNATPNDRLYLDAAKLSFGDVKTSDLILNKQTDINLLYHTTTSAASIATTYALGQTILRLVDANGAVEVINGHHNIYNWDKGGSLLRKGLINGERLRAGVNDTHGFPVYIYGTGNLTPAPMFEW